MSRNILEEVEKELSRVQNDESLKDVKFSKESEVELFAQIAQYEEEMSSKVSDGKYAQLSEEDRELIELGREAKARINELKEKENERESHNQNYKRRRSKRMTLALAAAMVLTFAMGTVGMTSKYKELRSEELYAEEIQYRLLESEDDLVQPSDIVKEQEAKQQIEKFFGQPVLWLYGDEIDVLFENYLIYENTREVEVIYDYLGSSVVLRIIQGEDKISGMEIWDEKVVEVSELRINERMYEISKSGKDGETRIQVKYASNNVQYMLQISSILADQIELIIKNIK